MTPFSKPVLRYFALWMLIGLLVFFALVKLAAIDRTLDEMSGGLIIQLLAFLPLIWFLLYHLNGKLDFRFFFRKHLTGIRWKQLIVVGLSLWVFTFGLEGVQLALIRWISPNLAGGWEEGPIYLGDQPMILNLLNIMLAVVVGPLMEELVFRGLLLQRLMVKMSVNRALIISSILFGVLHFESWLSAAIFGLMMGLLFLKTSNLWVPIIVHIFNNLVVVSLNLWQYRQGQVWTLEEAHIFLPIYLVAFMILPVIIIFIRKYWPQDHMQLPYLLNQSHQ